jgi:hypothetical protein
MSNIKKSSEEMAYVKMSKLLHEHGLQIALKTFHDALYELLENRGDKSPKSLIILEVLKGLHTGYLRRHEEEDFLLDQKSADES